MSIWSSVHPAVRVDAAEEEGNDNHPDHGNHWIDVAGTAMSPHIRLAIFPAEDNDFGNSLTYVHGDLYLTPDAARQLAINLLHAIGEAIPETAARNPQADT